MGATCFSETVANFYHIIHYTPEGIFFFDHTVNTSTVTEVTEFDLDSLTVSFCTTIRSETDIYNCTLCNWLEQNLPWRDNGFLSNQEMLHYDMKCFYKIPLLVAILYQINQADILSVVFVEIHLILSRHFSLVIQVIISSFFTICCVRTSLLSKDCMMAFKTKYVCLS
jgi:hypothetical protein